MQRQRFFQRLALSLAAAFLVTTLGAGQLFAEQPQPERRQFRRHKRFDGKRIRQRLTETLKLTPQQQAKLFPLLKKQFGQARLVRKEIRTNRRQLRQLMQTDAPDQVKVKAVLVRMVQLREVLRAIGAKTRTESAKILDPVQQVRMIMIMKRLKRRGRRMMRRHHRRGLRRFSY